MGISLKSKQRNWPSSRDEVVNTGLLSSCSRKLGVSLKLHQFLSGPLDMHKRSQASFRVLRGNVIALKSMHGNWSSSRIEGGISWFFFEL